MFFGKPEHRHFNIPFEDLYETFYPGGSSQQRPFQRVVFEKQFKKHLRAKSFETHVLEHTYTSNQERNPQILSKQRWWMLKVLSFFVCHLFAFFFSASNISLEKRGTWKKWRKIQWSWLDLISYPRTRNSGDDVKSSWDIIFRRRIWEWLFLLFFCLRVSFTEVSKK